MTAVATIQHPKSQVVVLSTDEQLRDFLTGRQGEFALLAKSSGVEPERLVAELVAIARKKPEILRCAPESIMNFMYDAAKLGLVIGHGCFPVPVRDNKAGVTNLECWIGYKGMKELVIYGRTVRDVFAEIRYEDDPFEEVLGAWPDVKHARGPHNGNRAKMLGVYAVAVISQTIRRHVYLSREKVEALRKMNRADTTSPKSPWMSHPEAMWKAKAMLALTRDIPRNPRLAHALAVIERTEGLRDDADEAPVRLDPAREVAAPASAPAAPTGFEEEVAEAVVTLPNWRGHPLAGRPIRDVERNDLEALYSQLRESDKSGQYAELIGHLEAELDERRGAA